jgi:hypothetical protein
MGLYPPLGPRRTDGIDPIDNKEVRAVPKAILSGLAWLSWQAFRWPLLAFMIVLEPVVRVALGLSALLGTLTALFWRFAVDPPGFPFFIILGISLACIPALAVYYLAMRLLAEA